MHFIPDSKAIRDERFRLSFSAWSFLVGMLFSFGGLFSMIRGAIAIVRTHQETSGIGYLLSDLSIPLGILAFIAGTYALIISAIIITKEIVRNHSR